MRRNGLIFAMILLLVGAAVLPADGALGQSIRKRFDINVQDDVTGSYLLLDSWSGLYQFTRCSDGLVMKGRGVVEVKGCSTTLTDLAEGHKVLVTVDSCLSQAKASIEVFDGNKELPAMTETLVDADMQDNVRGCSKPVK